MKSPMLSFCQLFGKLLFELSGTLVRMDELSAIPQALRELALQRFQLLRPHLEGDRTLRAIASDASIPYRTAYRWASGYRKDGLAALARKSRTDQGQRRLASSQLIQAIEGLALERPPLPISSIHRQARAMAETLWEHKPSSAVVRRIVKSLPAGLLMLAHRGNRAYSEGFDLVHRREAYCIIFRTVSRDNPNSLATAR
ncbi:helix-turn-helix domain-containing protein [Granulicella aggregans]